MKIIMAAGALGANQFDTEIDTFLRAVAEKYKADKREWADKYGIDFENDKFMMHKFCWCEKDDCAWCGETAPNFWYKPLDFKVKWYKYIGRSVEVNKMLTLEEFKQMQSDLL
jgi:hypothetical protein